MKNLKSMARSAPIYRGFGPNHKQQEYCSDAISNRCLNRVSVGTWWIFGWRRKSPVRSSLHEEDESDMGSCWPLGRKREWEKRPAR
jgi:hypothetical protein